MTATANSEIVRLESLVKDLTEALEIAKTRLLEAKVSACPVAVGDIVLGAGGHSKRNGKRFIVREVVPFCSEAWVKASPQNANGQWSKNAINLFNNWTKEKDS